MIISRMEEGFSFFMAVGDEPFGIAMWLGDDGTEELRLVSDDLRKVPPGLSLASGSIKCLVGKWRWKNFLRMREAGHQRICLPRIDTQPDPV